MVTVKCKDGNEYQMPADVWAGYRRLFPSADDEFAKMAIWLELNPSKWPLRPDTAASFVSKWFKKVRAAQPERIQRGLMADLLTGRTHASDFRADDNIIDITPAKRKVG